MGQCHGCQQSCCPDSEELRIIPSGRTGSALALQGMGLRSLVHCTGLMAGLMASQGEGSLATSRLFNRVDGFSTSGGTSLFFASLAYSERFVKLLEDLASKPEESAATFKNSWIKPWASRGHKANPLAKVFSRIARFASSASAEDILLWSFFWKEGQTWQRCVEGFFEATAGMPAHLPLCGEPCEWARERLWIANATLLAPRYKEKGVLLWRNPQNDGNKVTYYIEGTDLDRQVPSHIPARLAVVLGSETSHTAAVPLISGRGLQDEATMVFVGVRQGPSPLRGGKSTSQRVTHRSDPIRGFPKTEEHLGRCPLSGIVAASAASCGGLLLEPLSAELKLPSALQLGPIIGDSAKPEAFTLASKMAAQVQGTEDTLPRDLEHLANIQARCLVDGSFTDSTGICNAVSAGAREVTAILCSDQLTSCPTALLRLFSGNTGNGDLSEKLLFPIFAYPSSDQVEADFQDFETIQAPPEGLKLKYLDGVKVGSIYLARTLDNVWFDIRQDRIVKLNVVCISSKLSVRNLEDMELFGDLLKELVHLIALPESSELVQSTLLPMMMGSTS
mmetsp:Transcript_23612/g.50372  ORF Transcript_23612/g.50372 Transcript_23612/m.50372 type:complete len:562 (+) Transcript_23612:292-1977(+)|eukprot:CAMPEP_0206529492 /NCGR_PEP_ID=MMETSP0325_2-20121206/2629_1 /ASSEMBLY_ACC=CAM_ASM_000347 /TAXON_ID=2866 /ORGANISM="Crypthecodinium cohnii, Strain Seligo" /LENGTH=561 /DNA_ID=CAMNT_0054025409 /DNA_START=178 /DNA_END=1863 /DNA_ORIENTATION=-